MVSLLLWLTLLMLMLVLTFLFSVLLLLTIVAVVVIVVIPYVGDISIPSSSRRSHRVSSGCGVLYGPERSKLGCA